MKELSSNSISGPEAVVTAAIQWWLDTHPNILETCARRSEDLSRTPLKSFKDEDIGQVVWGEETFEIILRRFWQDIRLDAGVKHMIQLAVQAWQVKKGQSGVSAARTFVRLSMSRLFGRVVKAQPSFKKLVDERKEKKPAKKSKAAVGETVGKTVGATPSDVSDGGG